MSTTPNFDITLLQANQNNKEVTANQAFVEMEAALSDFLAVTMTDADYTLTTGEDGQALGNVAFEFSGVITANRKIIIPQNKKLYLIMNATEISLGFSLQVTTNALGSRSVNIPCDTTNFTWVYCDGTNVILASLPPGVGSGTVTNNEGALGGNQIILGNGGADVFSLGTTGTLGQVLTSNGPGVAPSWQAGGGGGGGVGSGIPVATGTPHELRWNSSTSFGSTTSPDGITYPSGLWSHLGGTFTNVNSGTSGGKPGYYKLTASSSGTCSVSEDAVAAQCCMNIFQMYVFYGGLEDATSGQIIWLGFSGSLYSGLNVAAPSTTTFGFRFVRGTDTHWQAYVGTGSSTNTLEDTGITPDTSFHQFAIVKQTNGDLWFYIDGSVVATIAHTATGFPASTTAMYCVQNIGVPGATASAMDMAAARWWQVN